MTASEPRALRVVLFGGPYLDRPALRFALLLEAHPKIELVGVLCEAPGSGPLFRMGELVRRRSLLAVPVALRVLLTEAAALLRNPAGELDQHVRARRLRAKIRTVPDVHASDVLEQVRLWRPDVGAIYGAPILRPPLFEIPPLGTLGIHHGRVPYYRGKKTTFWEMYNGEACAGVTIQRVNAGIDTGDVVAAGEVPIGTKTYGRVERETQELGFALYLDALLALRDGRAVFQPQPAGARGSRSYGQPNAADFLKLWLRTACRRWRALRP